MSAVQAAPRIGARLVVELLRLKADEPLTDKIRLTPQRSRHALAVLNDKFALIHKTLNLADVTCSIAHAMSEQCSDLEVALPIAAPDWGAILLVDELFDKLAQQLANDKEAAAWFARLRILVVRYAIKDYSFFFAQQNLLRRFLNQAYLTLLSNTEKSRLVHREMLNQFGKRILAEFNGDVGHVNSLCIEAQAWFAGQTEKVEQIEERLRVLESTRRREKVAEPRVVAELNRIAGGQHLPEEVIDFLHGEWRRSMLIMSMREGQEGADWKRQLRTAESLIELCKGCQDDTQRSKYRSFYQVFLRNVRTLLVSVLDDADALDAAVEPLELVLSAMINGACPALLEVKPIPLPRTQVIEAEVTRVSPKALEAIEQLSENDWLRLKTSDGRYELCKIVLKAQQDEPWVLVSQSGKTVAKKSAIQLAQALEGGVLQLVHRKLYWDRELDAELERLHQAWQEQQAAQSALQSSIELASSKRASADSASKSEAANTSRIDELLKDSSLSLDEPIQPDSQNERRTDQSSHRLEAIAEPDDESFLTPRAISDEEMSAALSAVDTIQVGGWISQETSEGEQRCKLAVKIRATDKMVFVNRLGIKILDITRQELARLLIHGAVTILDTGAGFDSTLERVVRSIQKDKN